MFCIWAWGVPFFPLSPWPPKTIVKVKLLTWLHCCHASPKIWKRGICQKSKNINLKYVIKWGNFGAFFRNVHFHPKCVAKSWLFYLLLHPFQRLLFWSNAELNGVIVVSRTSNRCTSADKQKASDKRAMIIYANDNLYVQYSNTVLHNSDGILLLTKYF